MIYSEYGLTQKESLEQFKRINDLHPHINFTAEFSTDEITFLNLCLYEEERFAKEGILDIKTHIKPNYILTAFTNIPP